MKFCINVQYQLWVSWVSQIVRTENIPTPFPFSLWDFRTPDTWFKSTKGTWPPPFLLLLVRLFWDRIHSYLGTIKLLYTATQNYSSSAFRLSSARCILSTYVFSSLQKSTRSAAKQQHSETRSLNVTRKSFRDSILPLAHCAAGGLSYWHES